MKRSEHCGKCGALKIILKGGVLRCEGCHLRRDREYYHGSAHRREMERRSYVFRRYGVRLEQLDSLLREQNDSCAICHKHCCSCVRAKKTRHEAIYLHHLCIDHDHGTQRVRGLLCNACNIAIGLFEENETRFANAVLYLRRHALLEQKQQLAALANRLQCGFQTSCETVTGFGRAL
jgi:hypothetical protein